MTLTEKVCRMERKDHLFSVIFLMAVLAVVVSLFIRFYWYILDITITFLIANLHML